MSYMVTRCPKCATAFRVTTMQLESAKGSVRCGSCLHIFKAHDDLISTTSEKDKTLEIDLIPKSDDPLKIDITEKQDTNSDLKIPEINIDGPADQETAEDSNIYSEDNPLISDDMDEPAIQVSSYEFEGYMDIDLNPTPTVSLFERDIQLKPEKESEIIDESWAEALLDEEESFSNSFKRNENKTISTETEITTKQEKKSLALSSAIMERHSIDIPDEDEYARINREFSTLYKTPLFNIVEEDNENSEDNQPSPTSEVAIHASRDDQELVNDPVNTPTTFGKGFFRNQNEPELSSTQKHPLKSQPAIPATQDSRASLLMNIATSPIELTTKHLRNCSTTALWLSLSILAALIFVGQIAYFKFNSLSRIEPYRTAYVWLCPLMHCKVPGLVDTNQIIAYQLILRNHPEAQNALIVDAMIRNDAPFEQPFPDLILAFSSIDNAPIASRRFTPKEYLGGELAGMERIPSKQPVHITLELSDPGPQAVNYHMSIAP